MANFCIVDLETLGFAPPAAIIESAEVYYDGNTIIQTDNRLYGMSGQIMEPENRACHHISPDLLTHQDNFNLEEYSTRCLAEVDIMVAHKAEFEQQWLQVDLPWICTYKCALRLWEDAPKHDLQTLKYWLGIKDSESYYPPHRALPDALLTQKILEKQLEETSVENLLSWSAEPALYRKFHFGKYYGKLLSEAPTDYLQWIIDKSDQSIEIKYWCYVEIESRK